MLFDLTAIDERLRVNRDGQPASDFTIVYHLMRFDDSEELRIKVPLSAGALHLPSITDLWANANWYEREIFDLFGIGFRNHPNLVRILMPLDWEGHPLRKDYPVHGYKYGYAKE